MLPRFADIDSEPDTNSDADETPLAEVRRRARTRSQLRKGLDDGEAQWLKWVGSNRFYRRVCERVRKRAEAHQGAQPGKIRWSILRELPCSWRCLNPECHLASHILLTPVRDDRDVTGVADEDTKPFVRRRGRGSMEKETVRTTQTTTRVMVPRVCPTGRASITTT